MKLSHLLPDDFTQPAPPEWWEVEPNLSPAARRAVRLARIEAYERTPALAARYLWGERLMLEADQ